MHFVPRSTDPRRPHARRHARGEEYPQTSVFIILFRSAPGADTSFGIRARGFKKIIRKSREEREEDRATISGTTTKSFLSLSLSLSLLRIFICIVFGTFSM